MKKPLSNTFNRTRKARNDILEKPMREETKSVEGKWTINWKAIMTEKLFDAQVAPATIVRIIETQEKLFTQAITQAREEERERIKKVLKKRKYKPSGMLITAWNTAIDTALEALTQKELVDKE